MEDFKLFGRFDRDVLTSFQRNPLSVHICLLTFQTFEGIQILSKNLEHFLELLTF